MITTLILILILLAAFSLVWWGVGRLTLPEPIKTIVLVLMGLVALLFIYQVAVGGWHAPILR